MDTFKVMDGLHEERPRGNLKEGEMQLWCRRSEEVGWVREQRPGEISVSSSEVAFETTTVTFAALLVGYALRFP